jgi:predicted nucleotidyltransferase
MNVMERENPADIMENLKLRREVHKRELWEEVERIKVSASRLGLQRVILFGSLVHGDPGLASDLDLLIVWDTALGFLERTAELYRRLQPRVAADFLVYTPEEMMRMKDAPLVRRALEEGKILYEA